MEGVRIVIPDDFPVAITGTPAFDRLKAVGAVAAYNSKASSQQELLERLKEAHTVVNIRAYTKFTSQVLESLKCTLRHIAIWGVGTDHIDLDAAKRLGITVSSTPDTASESVAEHCLALMLALARRIVENDSAIRQGGWRGPMLVECRGKTLGVIGTGYIGTAFARLGMGTGMKVIAWDPFGPDQQKAEREGFKYVDALDELLAESDVVAIHVRSGDLTRGMIGASQFARMKDGAIFLNTARGDLVDEKALVEALRSGKLLGAGLDAFVQEPLPKDSPLLELSNVVLSPHTAGITAEAVSSGLMRCVDNVADFLATGSVKHRVV